MNVPLRLPQATLDDKQQSALTKTERELALSRLKGEEKERVRLGYAADDLGFVGIRIRRRDNVISVMPWKPGAITRRINPNPGWKIRDGKSGRQFFPAAEAAERATGTGRSEHGAGEAEVPDSAG
ncbi:tail component of prophage CP-933X [Escherichia coli]|nr:tail component of prophage CP-933X [Escherichia coli]